MMMIRTLLAALTALATLAPAGLSAQGSSTPLPADEAFAMTVDHDANGMTLSWDIADGYYLYRDNFSATGPNGASLPLETPEGERKDDPNFGTVEVFYDSITARLDTSSGPVTLTWQGCMNDSICYPPQTQIIELVGAEGATPTASASTVTEANTSPEGFSLAEEKGILAGLSDRGGTALVVAGFFGLGLLLAFTPCVFPMFPIVAGMVMGHDTSLSARRGLALAGAYVLAMAAAFAGLGVVAAWSGQNLQIALQSPVAIGLAATIFVILALSMFGLFTLQMPQAITNRLSRVEGRSGSLGGAALLGFTSALIVGPCVTAPLAGALLYIAQTGDVALGACALFALGLGQGVPLLAIGAFGPRVLPKSGPWMESAKTLFGVLFLGFAIWLAARVLPGPLTLALWAVLLIGLGVMLTQITPQAMAGRLGRAVGVIILFAGALQGIGAGVGANDPLRPLAPFAGRAAAPAETDDGFVQILTTEALHSALADTEKPALAYVTADWCTTCRSIERGPMADAEVRDAFDELTLLKIDVTDFGPESQALLDQLGAAGPPTMVFFDADSAEAPGSRIVGDTGREEMLRSLRMVTR
ncbi:protein-disulfide reductase DsbD [Roseovarius pacificus]|uniref:protein-disulfide reductase DsbD n=1 Tax=Roseovarius pacificus TaxID=337701 RepID=UPI002A189B6D|nr:protein-disulfide reductase DsbD [Roseovarius pacificus]